MSRFEKIHKSKLYAFLDGFICASVIGVTIYHTRKLENQLEVWWEGFQDGRNAVVEEAELLRNLPDEDSNPNSQD